MSTKKLSSLAALFALLSLTAFLALGLHAAKVAARATPSARQILAASSKATRARGSYEFTVEAQASSGPDSPVRACGRLETVVRERGVYSTAWPGRFRATGIEGQCTSSGWRRDRFVEVDVGGRDCTLAGTSSTVTGAAEHSRLFDPFDPRAWFHGAGYAATLIGTSTLRARAVWVLRMQTRRPKRHATSRERSREHLRVLAWVGKKRHLLWQVRSVEWASGAGSSAPARLRLRATLFGYGTRVGPIRLPRRCLRGDLRHACATAH